MARGTIHAVDDTLFLVEGEWPDDPSTPRPGPAVLRSGDRLCLLDTGSGPEQRSAVRAIIASFPAPGELMILNSGCHPGLTGNNDLLGSFPADRRTHVSHRWHGAAGPAAGDETRVELAAIAEPVSLDTAAGTWQGWRLPDVTAVEVSAHSARLAFWLPRQRTLLLPDELALAAGWPDSDLAEVRRVGQAVLDLIDAGAVEVVSLGFGGPLGAGQARTRIRSLVDRTPAAAPAGGSTTGWADLLAGSAG